jgi:hypothetical protein
MLVMAEGKCIESSPLRIAHRRIAPTIDLAVSANAALWTRKRKRYPMKELTFFS